MSCRTRLLSRKLLSPPSSCPQSLSLSSSSLSLTLSLSQYLVSVSLCHSHTISSFKSLSLSLKMSKLSKATGPKNMNNYQSAQGSKQASTLVQTCYSLKPLQSVSIHVTVNVAPVLYYTRSFTLDISLQTSPQVESLVVLESVCPMCLTRDPMEAPSRSPSYSLGARRPTMRGSPRSTTLIQNIFQRQLSGASTTNHCRSEGPHGDRPSRY